MEEGTSKVVAGYTSMPERIVKSIRGVHALPTSQSPSLSVMQSHTKEIVQRMSRPYAVSVQVCCQKLPGTGAGSDVLNRVNTELAMKMAAALLLEPTPCAPAVKE